RNGTTAVDFKRPAFNLNLRKNIFVILDCARGQLREGDIHHDPGLRKPIESLYLDIRDVARRMDVNMGPCQPTGH
uniref:Uncharacterized protein n=1 Tax=Triticum urartu TaxID=4572 RepID=A0A8R7URU1_TRIUA